MSPSRPQLSFFFFRVWCSIWMDVHLTPPAGRLLFFGVSGGVALAAAAVPEQNRGGRVGSLWASMAAAAAVRPPSGGRRAPTLAGWQTNQKKKIAIKVGLARGATVAWGAPHWRSCRPRSVSVSGGLESGPPSGMGRFKRQGRPSSAGSPTSSHRGGTKWRLGTLCK